MAGGRWGAVVVGLAWGSHCLESDSCAAGSASSLAPLAGRAQAGDVRSQGLVPEWTFRLVAGTKIGMLEPHVSAFAPPYASELASLLGGGVCPYTVERHRQFLFGDKRFIKVRMCILIRLLLLPPQTYWKNPRGCFLLLLF